MGLIRQKVMRWVRRIYLLTGLASTLALPGASNAQSTERDALNDGANHYSTRQNCFDLPTSDIDGKLPLHQSHRPFHQTLRRKLDKQNCRYISDKVHISLYFIDYFSLSHTFKMCNSSKFAYFSKPYAFSMEMLYYTIQSPQCARNFPSNDINSNSITDIYKLYLKGFAIVDYSMNLDQESVRAGGLDSGEHDYSLFLSKTTKIKTELICVIFSSFGNDIVNSYEWINDAHPISGCVHQALKLGRV